MKALVLAVLLASIAGSAGAVETAAFLNLGTGARYLALGGAGTASADDANALYWNPAGLAGIERREASVSDIELQQGTRISDLAYAHPSKYGTFAAGGTYLSQQAIEGRDALGRQTSSFQASDAAVRAGYARKTDFSDFGATLKYVQSHIGSAQAQTVGLDLGFRRAFGPVVFGAALRNAGPGMRFASETDDLPTRLAFGGAYRFAGGHSFAVEATNAPRAGGWDCGFGGEYQAFKDVYLRAGYTTQTAISGGSSFDAAGGLTLGLGWRSELWRIDYAAVPMGELGTSHRFTLGARWR